MSDRETLALTGSSTGSAVDWDSNQRRFHPDPDRNPCTFPGQIRIIWDQLLGEIVPVWGSCSWCYLLPGDDLRKQLFPVHVVQQLCQLRDQRAPTGQQQQGDLCVVQLTEALRLQSRLAVRWLRQYRVDMRMALVRLESDRWFIYRNPPVLSLRERWRLAGVTITITIYV